MRFGCKNRKPELVVYHAARAASRARDDAMNGGKVACGAWRRALLVDLCWRALPLSETSVIIRRRLPLVTDVIDRGRR